MKYFSKKLSRLLLLGSSFFLAPSITLASDSVSFTGALNNFLAYLTGDVGKAIALLAIVGVGYGCFVLGKLSKGAACTTVLGIGIVFGAHGLLTTLTGSL